jgi:soluble lytic murein transglycosylase
MLFESKKKHRFFCTQRLVATMLVCSLYLGLSVFFAGDSLATRKVALAADSLWQQYTSFVVTDDASNTAPDPFVNAFITHRNALENGQFTVAEKSMVTLSAAVDWAMEPLLVYERLIDRLANQDMAGALSLLKTGRHVADLPLLKQALQKDFRERFSANVEAPVRDEVLSQAFEVFPEWHRDPAMLQLLLSVLTPADPRWPGTLINLWSYSDIDRFSPDLLPLVEQALSPLEARSDAVVEHFRTQRGWGRHGYILSHLPRYLSEIRHRDDDFLTLRQLYFQSLIYRQRYTQLIQLLEDPSSRQAFGVNDHEALSLMLTVRLRKGDEQEARLLLDQIEAAVPDQKPVNAYLAFADFHFQRQQFGSSRDYLLTALPAAASAETMAFIQWRLLLIAQELKEEPALRRIIEWSEQFEFADKETAAKFCYWGVKLNIRPQARGQTCYHRYPSTYYGYRALSQHDPPQSPYPMALSKEALPQQRALTIEERRLLLVVGYLYQQGDEDVADHLVRRYLDRHQDLYFFIHLSQILHRAQRFYLQQLMAEIHFRQRFARPGEPASILLPVLYPTGYRQEVAKHAGTLDLPKSLVFAVIREESGFRPDVVSRAGAIGLMQLMPRTAQYVGQLIRLEVDLDQLFDPDLNILLGTTYLKRLLRQYEGNLYYALAAYNGGPTNVNRWRRKLGNTDIDFFVESITFSETRRYVKKVMRSYFFYRNVYG